jgi:hypothetical protein
LDFAGSSITDPVIQCAFISEGCGVYYHDRSPASFTKLTLVVFTPTVARNLPVTGFYQRPFRAGSMHGLKIFCRVGIAGAGRRPDVAGEGHERIKSALAKEKLSEEKPSGNGVDK